MFVSIQLALATYAPRAPQGLACVGLRACSLGETRGNSSGFAMYPSHADSLRPEAYT